jgi:diguanylate cyclase (GGDEF)-like protein
MIRGSILFAIILCGTLSIASYMLISRALYDRYNDSLANILTYINDEIDAEDMYKCFETKIRSEQYDRIQAMLNDMVDDFDLMYLYILQPHDKYVENICTATSDAEREEGEEDMIIGQKVYGYPDEELQRYASYMESEGISYFEESSTWGDCYTALMPLKDGDGNTYGLICADIEIDHLHNVVHTYVAVSVFLMIVVCCIFVLLMITWIRGNVTGPIQQLEKSARDFADKSHSIDDIRNLDFDVPVIKTGNEVQSLAEAIDKMSVDIKTYVNGIMNAEARADNARAKAETMTAIAFKDALTHVKSKAAYLQKEEELNRKIADGTAEFGIVMVDLNNLKNINDTYGHDKGDEYLTGSCALICNVYEHSPVYRIGGDEFVVVLEGRDYENRENLYTQLGSEFISSRQASTGEPWEHFSAAGGMAVYDGRIDRITEDVFKRADAEMYRDKTMMKASGNA